MTDQAQSRSQAGRLQLSAPADPAILEVVHAMLESLWSVNPEVGDADRGRFEMAVIEILGNIVEHAYALDQDAGRLERRFDISLCASDSELVAVLEDNGKPMPLDLGNVAMPDELAETGRGLALANAALDDLSYDRVDGRNHWRLLCLRQAG